jgi:anthranilate phosphoribosyltransferase
VTSTEISPEQFGIERARLDSIGGGDVEENARIIRAVLAGEQSPKRDVVLLNASAALVAAGKADSLGAALPLAGQSLDSGAALQKLEQLVAFTSQR